LCLGRFQGVASSITDQLFNGCILINLHSHLLYNLFPAPCELCRIENAGPWLPPGPSHVDRAVHSRFQLTLIDPLYLPYAQFFRHEFIFALHALLMLFACRNHEEPVVLIVAVQLQGGDEVPEQIDGPAVVLMRLSGFRLAEPERGDAVYKAELGHTEARIAPACPKPDDFSLQKGHPFPRFGLFQKIRGGESRITSTDDRNVDVDDVFQPRTRRVLTRRKPEALVPKIYALFFRHAILHFLFSPHPTRRPGRFF